MEPEVDVSEDSKQRSTSDSTPAAVKSEPVEDETGGNTSPVQNWHEPIVIIKTEPEEENKPETILPDWSYLNPESDCEAEGKDECPVAVEMVKREHLPEYGDVEKSYEDKELGRERLAEVMSEVNTNTSKAGKLYSHDQSQLMSTEHDFSGTDKYKVGDEHWRINTTHVKPYECLHCGQTFSKKGSLNKHIRNVHLKVKPLECEHCGQKFGQNCVMKLHIQTVHLKVKLFECHECGQRFSRKWQMNKHIQIVHLKEKEFECEQCGQRFSHKWHMSKHVQTVHLKEKQYECQQCGQRFGLKCNMKKHVQTVHLKEKRFECEHCLKKFRESSHLRRHIQIFHVKD